jgi:putative transposase
MEWLNLSYGAWFNRRWQRSEPLVQGRFKAILHEPENTALIINRYMHLNPVRVRALGGHEARSSAERQPEISETGPSRELVKARVEALSSYRWSSYPAYVGRVRNPGWLTTESIYRFFGDHITNAIREIWGQDWETLTAARGSGALPAAFFLGQRYAGLRKQIT